MGPTIEEAADRLGVCKGTIRNLERRGEIRIDRGAGSPARVLEDDLRRAIAKRRADVVAAIMRRNQAAMQILSATANIQPPGADSERVPIVEENQKPAG